MSFATPETGETRPARIVVLDDEAEIRGMLQRYLTAHGFEVRAAKSGLQLEAFLEREPYDLLVLDLMMPDEDGLSVCRRLRAQGHAIPILMLTARGDPADRVVGLEQGADDYLAKPFLPGELLARIRAILRRQQLALRQQAPRDGAGFEGETVRLKFGDFRLDLRAQTLSRTDGQWIEIGQAELRLLCALAQTPNRPVSRPNLIERTHGRDHDANARSVDVQVLRLRQIVEADASMPRFIRTVWGVGYMLMAEPEA